MKRKFIKKLFKATATFLACAILIGNTGGFSSETSDNSTTNGNTLPPFTGESTLPETHPLGDNTPFGGEPE